MKRNFLIILLVMIFFTIGCFVGSRHTKDKIREIHTTGVEILEYNDLLYKISYAEGEDIIQENTDETKVATIPDRETAALIGSAIIKEKLSDVEVNEFIVSEQYGTWIVHGDFTKEVEKLRKEHKDEWVSFDLDPVVVLSKETGEVLYYTDCQPWNGKTLSSYKYTE